MGAIVRKCLKLSAGAPVLSAVGMVALTGWLAGCSSDVSRFNGPTWGLTEARPIPSQPVYDGAAPANTQGYAPGASAAGAPPPDYNNADYGDNSHPAPGYPYRGPGAPAPYASAAPSYGYGSQPGAVQGFGTVPGQPESYHPERLASNGQTAYIVPPSQTSAPPAYVPPAGQPQTGFRLAPRRPASGSLVEVEPGESLYMFSRRNGVSISAVMQANNLRSPVVQPGIKLVIPGKGGRSILPPTASLAPASAPMASVAQADTPVANAFEAAATPVAEGPGDGPNGTYSVQAGDSIYSIARKHHINPLTLMAANGIKDVTKVRFGQVLKLPLTTGRSQPIVAANPSRPVVGTRLAALQPLPGKSGPVMNDAGAEGIPEGQTTSEGADTQNDMTPVAPPPSNKAGKSNVMSAAVEPIKRASNTPVDPASAPIGGKAIVTGTVASAASDASADVPSDGRFRWPVRGRIIGKFGQPGTGGAQNEGLDMAVPMGTEVHAAENGVVAYVGDELKGFGKLVLIRHADNWVTAYAHNDELLVQRGDEVRRGQVIAKSGKSGGIDQPLLHFELRKGSQPVDPMPHMASN